MNLKMKSIIWLPLVLLLQSCGWNAWRNDADARSNDSALFDPPTVTMLPSIQYQFREGTVIGRGQQWHSQYSYQRAIIIGK